jgi:hypothetical protein
MPDAGEWSIMRRVEERGFVHVRLGQFDRALSSSSVRSRCRKSGASAHVVQALGEMGNLYAPGRTPKRAPPYCARIRWAKSTGAEEAPGGQPGQRR